MRIKTKFICFISKTVSTEVISILTVMTMSANIYLVNLLHTKAHIWSVANTVVEPLKSRHWTPYKFGSSVYHMSSVSSFDVIRGACNLYCTHYVRLKNVLCSYSSHTHYKTMVHVTTENRAWFLEKKVCLSG